MKLLNGSQTSTIQQRLEKDQSFHPKHFIECNYLSMSSKSWSMLVKGTAGLVVLGFVLLRLINHLPQVILVVYLSVLFSVTSLEQPWNSHIAKFMGPTWGPPAADRNQVGPMLAPWTLLSWLHREDMIKISQVTKNTAEQISWAITYLNDLAYSVVKCTEWLEAVHSRGLPFFVNYTNVLLTGNS